MKRVLVTGGAGFIGSHLIDRLAQESLDELIAVDNLSRGTISNLRHSIGDIRFANGDLRDRAFLTQIMAQVDVVYHLAAQSNVIGCATDLDYSFSTNVVGTFEVLRSAAANGVSRVIFASSREVYGEPQDLPVPETAPINPKNAYGVTKAASEMYCRVFSNSDLQCVVLRLANVYGTRDFDRVVPIFLNRALRNLPLTLFGGDQLLDFVSVDTVVEVLIRAAKAVPPPGPVNVGSGKGTRLRDLAEQIISLTGSKSEIVILPAREVEVPRFVADTTRMVAHFGIATPADPMHHLSDLIRSAKDQLLSSTAAL